MTANPLDLIEARALAGTSPRTPQDIRAVVKALRAVEAVCATSEEHAAAYDDTASIYVDDVRAAIREALNG